MLVCSCVRKLKYSDKDYRLMFFCAGKRGSVPINTISRKRIQITRRTIFASSLMVWTTEAKLLVLNLLNIAKDCSSAWRLRTSPTGVLNHDREALAFVDIFQWPHGSNLTIHVLLWTLARLQHMPGALYPQMYNFYRENKVSLFLSSLQSWTSKEYSLR